MSTMGQSGHTAQRARVTGATSGSHPKQHNTTPTRFVEADRIRFAYRRVGDPVGTPIVLLQHFMGNFDNYDPAITDVLAMGREVILTDNAGVGLSTGEAPETVAGMARDAASLIDALGLEHVDLFGFSMGGYVAQQIAVDRPELVRRLILVGTGPRGGDGMGQLDPDVAPLFGTVYDPQDLMWLPIFFSPSAESQAAGRRFLERIRARTEDRDVSVSDATVAVHLAAARVGSLCPRQLRLPQGDPPADARGQRQRRHRRRRHQLLHPAAEPARRRADPLPGLQPRLHFQFTDRFVKYVTAFVDR
jgi:pimeloyl-ACP methyl ester carboxylesterase